MIKTEKYGLLSPTLNADLVLLEMRKAHDYQNNLIEIERWRRDEIRKIESIYGNIPQLTIDYDIASNDYETILKTKKKNNSNARANVSTPELNQQLKDAKSKRKACENKLKQARLSSRKDDKIKKAKDNISILENKKQSLLRKSDAAPWYGTYMLIDHAFGIPSAKGKTKGMPLYNGINPNNPIFRNYNGEGRIGIKQFQPYEPINKIININPTSKFLQIVPIPPPKLKKDGSQRKIGNKNLKLLRIRIGTGEKNAPIWAEFPMVYHRPLPSNSVINMVQITKKIIASREKWAVSISYEDNIQFSKNEIKKVVAFDLGWREFPDRIRIACWKDNDGKSGEISLPIGLGIKKDSNDKIIKNKDGNDKLFHSTINKLRKVKELKSGRDLDFDRVKQLFGYFVNSGIIFPQWFQDWLNTTNKNGKKINDITYISKWRSQTKLSKLILQWKNNRFTGDEDIYMWLEYWRYHDFHLRDYEYNLRNKSIGAIESLYKNTAAHYANNYDAAIFEDINLSNIAKGKVGSTNRQLTAPSKFRNACKNAFNMRGKCYEEIIARNTSRECAVCHVLNDIGGKLEYFCSGCNVELDRDENAAENILERGRKKLSDNNTYIDSHENCEHDSNAKNAVGARIDENCNENNNLQYA